MKSRHPRSIQHHTHRQMFPSLPVGKYLDHPHAFCIQNGQLLAFDKPLPTGSHGSSARHVTVPDVECFLAVLADMINVCQVAASPAQTLLRTHQSFLPIRGFWSSDSANALMTLALSTNRKTIDPNIRDDDANTTVFRPSQRSMIPELMFAIWTFTVGIVRKVRLKMPRRAIKRLLVIK